MEHEAAVWMQPPPQAVLRLLNPVVRRLLSSPFASRLPPAMAVLEFNGRRSGRYFAVPVGVHEVDGAEVVFTEATWRHNFAGGRHVCVRRGRERREGRAVLVEDPAVVADALGVAVEQVGVRNLAMRTTPGHRVTREDLVGLHRGMVRLELSD